MEMIIGNIGICHMFLWSKALPYCLLLASLNAVKGSIRIKE